VQPCNAGHQGGADGQNRRSATRSPQADRCPGDCESAAINKGKHASRFAAVRRNSGICRHQIGQKTLIPQLNFTNAASVRRRFARLPVALITCFLGNTLAEKTNRACDSGGY
jgi:hypothetical protein